MSRILRKRQGLKKRPLFYKLKQLENPELDSARDNLETDSGDYQSDVLSELTSTKRKASSSSDQSLNRPTKSAKKTNDKTPKVRSWTPERVELLLKYLKEYKVTCDHTSMGKTFNKIFRQCIQRYVDACLDRAIAF